MKKIFDPVIHNQLVALYPLTDADFGTMFAIAADPAIWEQHPYKNRWQEAVFRTFFDTSLESNGAFRIVALRTNQSIGGTRFYEYNKEESSIAIGGTFYAREYWGTGINQEVKKLMLDYIFNYVATVYFYIDQHNRRSQIAIERLGAKKDGEKQANESMIDFVYKISKQEWVLRAGR
ncbi:MAG TPA: GNAT family N-acetyltransferase [Chitinophagaceae bacterium]|nr:GNAT family N-acetyltransferase [Chitinophagaceae bacterium]